MLRIRSCQQPVVSETPLGCIWRQIRHGTCAPADGCSEDQTVLQQCAPGTGWLMAGRLRHRHARYTCRHWCGGR